MFTSSIKNGTLGILVLLLTTSAVLSQGVDRNDYRKWSLTLNSGASLGDMNQNDYFMSSSFSVNTKNTPVLGAGIQYAITPAWSVDLGYRYTIIKGRDLPFETSLNLVTLKNVFSLSQLLSLNQLNDRINPFLSAGFGYDMFTYDGPEDEFYAHNSSYNAGVGVAYRLTNAVDLITHYEYHFASNATDNETAGYGADLLNTLSAGLRINFGKKDSKHLSWRTVPVELKPSDYNRLLARADLAEDLERRINNINQRQQKKEKEYNQLMANKSEEIDSLKARLNNINEYASALEHALRDRQQESNSIAVNNETGFAEILPGGHYVQIFATYHQDIARDIRAHAAHNLEEVLKNYGQEIIIIQRKQFYEVIIGVFNNFEHAQKIQEIMTNAHDDAYVITFPRPVNLQPDFMDLKIMDDKPLVDIFD